MGASASTKSQSAVLNADGQVATLTPTCARGQRATGGGFSATAPNGLGVIPVVSESRKIGQKSWRVSVKQISAPGSTTVNAYAYCRKKADAPKTKTRATTVPFTNNGFHTADAACGSAGKAQAGGFFSSPAVIGLTVTDSYRIGNKTWRARSDDIGAAGNRSITSYVYCAKTPALKTKTGSKTSNVNGGFGAYTSVLSSDCGRGRRVVSGGFSQPGAASGGVFIWPWESFKVGKHWQHSALHSGADSTTLNSIAYCA
jgi:hypothetical protein